MVARHRPRPRQVTASFSEPVRNEEGKCDVGESIAVLCASRQGRRVARDRHKQTRIAARHLTDLALPARRGYTLACVLG